MPLIYNCVIHIFEIDPEVTISDYVGNWKRDADGYITSCHNSSDTKLACTKYSYIYIAGRNLTNYIPKGLTKGYLGIDGTITWSLHGKVFDRWTRLGRLPIINHKHSN